MKILSYGVAIVLVAISISFAAVPSRYPNGLSTMTPAQEATNSITPAVGDVNVQGALNVIGATAITGAVTATAGITSSVRYSAYTDRGQTLYTVYVATSLAVGETYAIAESSGKAGSFDVVAGTYSVIGSFTSAGVVTLTSNCSLDTSSTAANASTVNAYDGGITVYFENNSPARAVFYIKMTYIN